MPLPKQGTGNWLLRLGMNCDKPFTVRRVEVPEVPAPVDENPVVCTNDAATWSLAAIYMQEVIPE